MALRWELRDGGVEVALTGWGVVTDADVMRIATEVLRSPDVMRNVARFFSDFSKTERADVATETIHTLATVAHQVAAERLAAKARPAFVVVAQVGTTDLVFGLMRMFELLFEPPAWRVATFRDANEARGWLDAQTP